jgi:MarR family transcriptional regulator, organic hydroperoxide resistance regulator
MSKSKEVSKSTTQPATELSPSLKAFYRQIMKRSLRHIASVVQKYDLSFGQLGTLMRLQATGASSVTTIAENANLSLAAASHMVNRLVERGLLERREDPDDRRQKRVTISEVGRALIQDFDDAREAASHEILRGVPEEVIGRLEAALSEVLSYNMAETTKQRG